MIKKYEKIRPTATIEHTKELIDYDIIELNNEIKHISEEFSIICTLFYPYKVSVYTTTNISIRNDKILILTKTTDQEGKENGRENI